MTSKINNTKLKKTLTKVRVGASKFSKGLYGVDIPAPETKMVPKKRR